MLADLPDLAEVPQRVRRQLAQLCRRYDGHALRRFPPDKRHSLLVCFLLDRRQGRFRQVSRKMRESYKG